jgi:hypothetical protein
LLGSYADRPGAELVACGSSAGVCKRGP